MYFTNNHYLLTLLTKWIHYILFKLLKIIKLFLKLSPEPIPPITSEVIGGLARTGGPIISGPLFINGGRVFGHPRPLVPTTICSGISLY